ncbi:unnamed protein product [Ectocarpus sp. 12 AP-2014]
MEDAIQQTDPNTTTTDLNAACRSNLCVFIQPAAAIQLWMGSISTTPPNFSGGRGRIPSVPESPPAVRQQHCYVFGYTNKQDSGEGVYGEEDDTRSFHASNRWWGFFSRESAGRQSSRRRQKKRQKEKLTHARRRVCYQPLKYVNSVDPLILKPHMGLSFCAN